MDEKLQGVLEFASLKDDITELKIKFVEESDLNEGGHFEINEVKKYRQKRPGFRFKLTAQEYYS